jgi:hypothetical protein
VGTDAALNAEAYAIKMNGCTSLDHYAGHFLSLGGSAGELLGGSANINLGVDGEKLAQLIGEATRTGKLDVVALARDLGKFATEASTVLSSPGAHSARILVQLIQGLAGSSSASVKTPLPPSSQAPAEFSLKDALHTIENWHPEWSGLRELSTLVTMLQSSSTGCNSVTAGAYVGASLQFASAAVSVSDYVKLFELDLTSLQAMTDDLAGFALELSRLASQEIRQVCSAPSEGYGYLPNLLSGAQLLLDPLFLGKKCAEGTVQHSSQVWKALQGSPQSK